MKKKHQYAQSEPISRFNSPDTSEYSSREPSPALQGKQQQQHIHRYHILPYVIGAIGGHLVYKFGRWVLNKPATQMMINRYFNKGSRMIADAKTTMQKTDDQSQDALGPSHDQEEYKDIDDAHSSEPSTSQKEHTSSDSKSHPNHTPLPNSMHVGFHE